MGTGSEMMGTGSKMMGMGSEMMEFEGERVEREGAANGDLRGGLGCCGIPFSLYMLGVIAARSPNIPEKMPAGAGLGSPTLASGAGLGFQVIRMLIECQQGRIRLETITMVLPSVP